jgi:hypothetical protein
MPGENGFDISDKVGLLEGLRARNSNMSGLIQSLQKVKVLDGNLEHVVILDENTWTGLNMNDGKLSVGTQPMPSQLKEKSMFTGAGYPASLQEEIAYKITHELVHKYINVLGDHGFESYVKLQQLAIDARDGERGLTAWGNLYNDKSFVPAVEDVVELLTMFFWDSDYLRGFLSYLSSASADELRGHKLVGLEPEAVDVLFDLVESMGKLG